MTHYCAREGREHRDELCQKSESRLGEEHRGEWTKSWKNWKVGKEHNLKSVVMDGVKSGKFGKLENYENNDETMSQSEERLCQINHKRSRETKS